MLDIRLPMLSLTVVVVHVGRGRFHDDGEAGLRCSRRRLGWTDGGGKREMHSVRKPGARDTVRDDALLSNDKER